MFGFYVVLTPKEPPQIIEPEVKPSTPSKEKRKSASKTKEGNREVSLKRSEGKGGKLKTGREKAREVSLRQAGRRQGR